MQARSLDGGETWETAPMPCKVPGDGGLSSDEHVEAHLQIAQALQRNPLRSGTLKSLNFSHPAFAILCGRSGLSAGAQSWFYGSFDRCRSWEGPFGLPSFGRLGVEARTDCLVVGPSECLLFLTGTKETGDEGRPFCARTVDGGQTFQFVSWITPEPSGYAIMPSSVRILSGEIVTAVRCQSGAGDPGEPRNWIDLYLSSDLGRTWRFLVQSVGDTGVGGNPPSLIRLRDGRLCLTYGFRDPLVGIRAVISHDSGRSWQPPIILRDDGGDSDIGYTRSVQRADGKVVTAYYFNDRSDGERYIAATIWRP